MEFLAHVLRSKLTPGQRTRIGTAVHRLSASVSYIPRKPRTKLRALYLTLAKAYIRRFRSFGPEELTSCLQSLGVKIGDTVLYHSSFDSFNGFQGSIAEIINVFLDSVGESGNLLMVSLPYLSTTYDYVKTVKYFDVRKTPSLMGLISEDFRRRRGVLRSLHPTHPVLAFGPKAEWIVADHELSLLPCGPGTPFEKLALLDGKVVFFNARFTATFTFFHYLEDLISDKLPFPLYLDKPVAISVIDYEGRSRIVKTNVFSQEVINRRWPDILESELNKRKLIHRAHIGNSNLVLVRTRDVIRCVEEMAAEGRFFYDLS